MAPKKQTVAEKKVKSLAKIRAKNEKALDKAAEKEALVLSKSIMLAEKSESELQKLANRSLLRRSTHNPNNIPEELQIELRENILLGMSPDRAMLSIGVPQDVWDHWKYLAARQASEYKTTELRTWVEEISILEAMSEAALLRAVHLRPAGEWQAVMGILEKRFPKDWGKKIAGPTQEQSITFKYETTERSTTTTEEATNYYDLEEDSTIRDPATKQNKKITLTEVEIMKKKVNAVEK